MVSHNEFFNPQRYVRQCADLLGERYSPYRLGKPLEELDCVYDYDFKLLRKTENSLKYITRSTALKILFLAVTQGCSNHTQVHIRTAEFLARAKIHNRYLQPMYPNRTMVTDPLVLLELGEMRCGHVARVAYDLLTDGGGYKCRIVQLGGHVIAEIYYDDDWHYFDADNMPSGKHVMINQRIPSVARLSKDPLLIDCIGSGSYPYIPNPSEPYYYNAYFYFGLNAYSGEAFTLVKKQSKKEKETCYYGWNECEKNSYLFSLYPDFKIQYLSPTPYILDIKIEQGFASISWESQNSPSNNLKEFQVYISQTSRGWEYAAFYGSTHARQFATFPNGYQKDMYQKIFHHSSPAKVFHTAKHSHVKLPIAKEVYFVTISGIDWYGFSIGNTQYICSSEIRIKGDDKVHFSSVLDDDWEKRANELNSIVG